MEQRIQDLELIVSNHAEYLNMFGVVDPDLASTMLVFWLVEFIGAHAAGRVVRWLSKV